MDAEPDAAVQNYGIARWGGGYFEIGANGRLLARPRPSGPVTVDLYRVAHEARAAGLSWPVLVRFTDILRDRGRFFVAPTEAVYTGQIVGEHCKDKDIDVNIQRTRKMTNMRSSTAERALRIDPPVRLSLEEMLAYINEDELVEVTPANIRMRKRILDKGDRRRSRRAGIS